MGDVGSEKPLPETVVFAVDLMPQFYSDHALIVDEAGHLIERILLLSGGGGIVAMQQGRRLQ